jgi:serine/threonine protein phosphatase PrpC
LRRRFLSFDHELTMLDVSGQRKFKNVGCTANVAFIDHAQKMLYVANAGDARCLLANRGDSKEFI